MESSTSQTVIRRRVTISGRVQGVGYRAFVAYHAALCDVAGTVRNAPGGDVECVVEGGRDAVLTLIDKLHSGPAAARVTDVRVDVEVPQGERSFRVTD